MVAQSTPTLKLARHIALISAVGIVFVTFVLLLFAICDRCYPESAFPFISTYKPLAWAGLIVAGIFIWIGRSFPGNELPSRLLRKSNYFLGICLALTELSYLTSSLSK